MIISVVNIKGGVGKSTVASNLAVAFAGSKTKTMLVDADTQKSSVFWGDQRADLIDSPHVTVTSLTEKSLDNIKDFDHKIFVIDCGGSNNTALRKSISFSHLCIIVLQPTAVDIVATKKLLEIIEEIRSIKPEIDVRFLLNRVKHGARANNDVEDLFNDCVFPFFKTRLHDRVAYQYAFTEGKSVLELDDDKAQKEIFDLYKEIIGSLK